MPLLKKLRVLAAKVETTVGAAETLTASEAAFNAYDVMIQPTITMEERQSQANFASLSAVPGSRMGTATFRTDLGWDGTTTMPTWASVLLPACGVVESSQVYTPRSEAPGSNVKTITIAAYINGKRNAIAGAVGTFQLVMPTGRMAYIDWSFQGVWQAQTDAAILAPTYPTAAPIRFSSATLTYDSVAQCTESVTFDAGNEIVMRECPNTSGFVAGIIVGRNPRITMNPEARLVADDDKYGDWVAGTEAAISIVLDGPSDSTITLAAPKAQIMNAQEGDRSGIVIDDVEFALNKNAANLDQDYSLTFTEAT